MQAWIKSRIVQELDTMLLDFERAQQNAQAFINKYDNPNDLDRANNLQAIQENREALKEHAQLALEVRQAIAEVNQAIKD